MWLRKCLDNFWYIKYQDICTKLNGKKKRKKERVFGSGGPGGKLRPSRVQARARESRPSTGQGQETVWAREETVSVTGPRARESGRRQRRWGRGGEPAIPRGEPGRRWVQRRFSAGDPVPGERAGSIAREEAGMLKGGSNFARCDWEGVDHGGVAGLRGGSHRR
jgi:hypothetical protein